MGGEEVRKWARSDQGASSDSAKEVSLDPVRTLEVGGMVQVGFSSKTISDSRA